MVGCVSLLKACLVPCRAIKASPRGEDFHSKSRSGPLGLAFEEDVVFS